MNKFYRSFLKFVLICIFIKLFDYAFVIMGYHSEITAFMVTSGIWLCGLGNIILYIYAGYSSFNYKKDIYWFTGTCLILGIGLLSAYTYSFSSLDFMDFLQEEKLTALETAWPNLTAGLAAVIIMGTVTFFLLRRSLRPVANRARVHPVKFTLISFIIFFIFLPFVLYLEIIIMADNVTGDYIEIRPASIQSVHKEMTLGHKTVVLAGMMHIGEKKFYRQLLAPYTNNNIAVLLEGVGDKNKLVHKHFSYNKIADRLGLINQPASFNFEKKENIYEVNADLDISSLSQTTISFINMAAEVLDQSHNIASLWEHSFKLEKHFSDKDLKLIFHDLLRRRNDHLYKILRQELGRYETVIIPWGALHLDGLETRLQQDDFKVSKVTRFPVAQWW